MKNSDNLLYEGQVIWYNIFNTRDVNEAITEESDSMKKTKKFSRNYRIAAGITVVILLICCGLFVGILKEHSDLDRPLTEEELVKKEELREKRRIELSEHYKGNSSTASYGYRDTMERVLGADICAVVC